MARFAGLLVAVLVLSASCSGDAPEQAEVVATIPVSPHVGPDIKIGDDGDVWLPASDTFGGSEKAYADADHLVARIDPGAERVEARVPVPHPMTALAIGEGAVWVTGTDFGPQSETPRGSLVKIDPDENRVVLSVDLGDGSPSDVAVGFGSIWVSDSTADSVFRIDPDTGAVIRAVAVTGGPTSLAVTADAIWVTKPRTGEVRPIDPRTNTPGDAVGAGSNPAVLESDGRLVFVADYTAEDLVAIDPAEGIIRRTTFPSPPSRFDVTRRFAVVAEVEERALSVVRGTRRTQVLDDRLFVSVAISDDGATVFASDPEAGGVTIVRLPSTEAAA